MAAKKRSRKKIDLRDLPSLGIAIPPSTDDTPESDTAQQEQSTEVTPVLDTTQQEQPNSPVQEQDKTPELPASESVPEAAPNEETPKQEERHERTAQRPQLKILQTLSSASNASGEVFNPGDKIWAKAPWGKRAIAQIVDFYQDKEGNAWARYTSDESYPGWTWSGGCIRAQGLTKADPQ